MSPWWWYFGNALPRALLVAFPFAVVGVFCDARRVAPIFAVPTVFVSVYSFLPHKELRFIFPAIPLFNACAAVGVVFAWERCVVTQSKVPVGSSSKGKVPVGSTSTGSSKGSSNGSSKGSSKGSSTGSSKAKGKTISKNFLLKTRLARVVFAAGFFLQIAAHLLFLSAAQVNYPGGVAFAALHANAHKFTTTTETERHTKSELRVHVDAAAAMTGVSRFGEFRSVDASVSRASESDDADNSRSDREGSVGSDVGDARVRGDTSLVGDKETTHAHSKTSLRWFYSKTEGLRRFDFANHEFDYLLSREPVVDGFIVVDVTDGYAGMEIVRWRDVFPVFMKPRSTPAIYTHARVHNRKHRVEGEKSGEGEAGGEL